MQASTVVDQEAPPPRPDRFLHNILWNLLGVLVMLASGVFLSPYIVRHIGNEAFGVWSLVFSIIEYYWLLDLGFRSATLKYAAHYRETSEPEKINEVINTGLVYFSCAAMLIVAGTLSVAPMAYRFFRIAPRLQPDFTFLFMVIGVSWALGAVFNVFNACIEGFQRFDVSSRIWMLTVGVRTVGCAAVLAAGHGLRALGVMVVVSQVLGYLVSFFSFRRVFPALRLSPAYASRPMLSQLVRYGIHTFFATIAGQFLDQGAPVLIGHFQPVNAVGFYNLPVRLLRYTADAVARVGMVTGSRTAALTAREDRSAITELGIYANRYCFALYLLPTLFLSLYAYPLLRVWINPEFAASSAPLLPILGFATAFAVAGQFNSSAILYGLAEHHGYARLLAAEAILNLAGLLFAVPRYGILGAAVVAATLMFVFRGVATSILVCRYLEVRWPSFVAGIYVRPLIAGALTLVLGLFLRSAFLPGANWPQLISAGALISAVYVIAIFLFGLDPLHRLYLTQRMKRFALPHGRAAWNRG